ncbi:transcription repressor NadR [Butyrivibrio sp. NC3005]|uniref:transcription repressor NadR n=1 Tax=Butyrivibrio sp. NC3005 TaxID=1280685 RepID=UPI0004156DB9|nr:transcription repressor NadR [Butyrivibrio sp. NC3005]
MRISGEERRNRIIELLAQADSPISGSQLSKKLSVSRQVIVTDIALLKATRPDLVSTSSGYILMHASNTRRVYKVRHTDLQIEDELTTIVDLGGSVQNVYVEHKVYGTITAPLQISSKRDIQNYLKDMKSGVSSPLSSLTDGYHYHTIEARSERILDEIEDALREKGYLIETRKAPVIYEPKNYSNI